MTYMIYDDLAEEESKGNDDFTIDVICSQFCQYWVWLRIALPWAAATLTTGSTSTVLKGGKTTKEQRAPAFTRTTIRNIQRALLPLQETPTSALLHKPHPQSTYSGTTIRNIQRALLPEPVEEINNNFPGTTAVRCTMPSARTGRAKYIHLTLSQMCWWIWFCHARKEIEKQVLKPCDWLKTGKTS